MSNEAQGLNNSLAPAFPSPLAISCSGLTKREYFAALAMQGMLTNYDRQTDSLAITAIAYADALLERLSNDKS